MTTDTTEKKIVPLFGGDVAPNEPDPKFIETLEKAMAFVKAADASGVYVVVLHPNGGHHLDYGWHAAKGGALVGAVTLATRELLDDVHESTEITD